MINNWAFDHISLTVRDVFKAVKYYQSIGAVLLKGPSEEPPGDTREWKMYGKVPANFKIIKAQLRLSSLHIEMHQPIGGISLWQDYLNNHGEGIDHISFRVKDVKKEAAKLAQNGFTDILTITENNKLAAVIADTRQVGNIAIQIYSGSPLMVEKSSGINWTFGHIGATVKDIDKGIRHFQTLGAKVIDGPAEPDFDLTGWRYYGRMPSNIRIKSCLLEKGGLTIELHQPIEGMSPWMEYLEKYGEGVDHLGFHVDDIQAEMNKLVAKGFPLILSMCEDDKWIAAFMDTRKEGNITIVLSGREQQKEKIASWNRGFELYYWSSIACLIDYNIQPPSMQNSAPVA